MKTPHLVQYQGSKRIIAPEIVKFFQQHLIDSLSHSQVHVPLQFYPLHKDYAMNFGLMILINLL